MMSFQGSLTSSLKSSKILEPWYKPSDKTVRLYTWEILSAVKWSNGTTGTFFLFFRRDCVTPLSQWVKRFSSGECKRLEGTIGRYILVQRKVFDGAQTLPRPSRLLISGSSQIDLPPLPLVTAPPAGLPTPAYLLWAFPASGYFSVEFSPEYQCVKEFLNTYMKHIDLFKNIWCIQITALQQLW